MEKINFFEEFEKKWLIDFIKKDTVLISYPKSGRTWLRMILATILDKSDINISKYEMLPAFHHSPREMVSKFGNNCKSLKIVFLYRDPGDVILSLYAAMATSSKHDSRLGVHYVGSRSSFIRGNVVPDGADHDTEIVDWNKGFGINKIIKYNNQWHVALKHFKDSKVITYEDIHSDTFKTIKDLLDWLNFDCSDEIIKEAIKHSEFENMHKIEHGHGKNNLEHYKGSFGNSHQKKGRVRQGKVRAYLDDLSEEELEYVMEMKKKSLWSQNG